MSHDADEDDNWVDGDQRKSQSQVEKSQAKDRTEILRLAKLLATSPDDAQAPVWKAKLIELRTTYERNASSSEIQRLRTAVAEIRSSGAKAKVTPAQAPAAQEPVSAEKGTSPHLSNGQAKPKVTPAKPRPHAKDTPTPKPGEIVPPPNPVDGIWKQLIPHKRDARVVPALLVRLCEGRPAAFLLAQILYWFRSSKRTGRPRVGNKEWLAKSKEAFSRETGLTVRQVRAALEWLLKEGLIERRKGINPKAGGGTWAGKRCVRVKPNVAAIEAKLGRLTKQTSK